MTSFKKVLSLHAVRLLKNGLNVSLLVQLKQRIVAGLVQVLSVFRQTFAALTVQVTHKIVVVMVD